MLYPDGMYFADNDGFGMEDNNEVIVYAIIDTNLDIIEPFRPIKSISRYLRDLREGIKPNVEISPWAHFRPGPYVEREYIYNVIIIDGSESMSYVREEVIKIKKINVTIITDGYDNASSIYSKEDLDTYIDRLKSNGWDIIFHIIDNEYHEETDWEQEMKEMFGPWWDMPEDCI